MNIEITTITDRFDASKIEARVRINGRADYTVWTLPESDSDGEFTTVSAYFWPEGWDNESSSYSIADKFSADVDGRISAADLEAFIRAKLEA